MGSYFD